MFKIGILGSDNSHADRFSEILNRPDHPSYQPDAEARVVAIWGAEAERTQAVAEARAATEPRFKGTVDAADKELAALEARVGRLAISVPDAPPGLVVEVAGERVGDLSQVIVVAPGHVVVVARAAGLPDVRQEIDIAAGAKTR